MRPAGEGNGGPPGPRADGAPGLLLAEVPDPAPPAADPVPETPTLSSPSVPVPEPATSVVQEALTPPPLAAPLPIVTTAASAISLPAAAASPARQPKTSLRTAASSKASSESRAPTSAKGGGTAGANSGAGQGGGSGSPGYQPPRFLLRYKPLYPPAARAQHLEGTALVLAAIDASGRVTHATLRHSSGHAVLDRAALEAVRSWRFEPARQNGTTLAAEVELPVSFRFTL